MGRFAGMGRCTVAKLSREEFLSKIEWEGGIEGALHYGLQPTDCGDDELAGLWRQIQYRYEEMQFSQAYQKLLAILEDE